MGCTNSIIEKKLDSLLDETPYCGYVFYLYLFIEKLYMKARQDGAENLFFLSREGEFLKKLFDLYIKLNNCSNITSHYFFTSRKASFICSLKEIENEDFDTLFLKYKDISLSEFMKNCGFPLEDIEHIEKETAFDINKVERDLKNTAVFKSFIKNSLFVEKYDNIRNQQNTLFEKYLKNFGVDFSVEKFNIVDVGWKGTIQDNLYRTLGHRINIHGYYLGLNETTFYNAYTEKEGLLFSNIDGISRFFDLFMYDVLFLERLLFASHGSVMGYEEKDASVVAKTKFFDGEEQSCELILETQKKIFELFSKVNKILTEENILASDIVEVIAKLHLKVVLNYSEKEKCLQQNLLKKHVDNFGIVNFEKNRNYVKTTVSEILSNTLKFDFIRRSYLFTLLLNVNPRIRDYSNVYIVFKFLTKAISKVYFYKQKKFMGGN